MDNIVEEAEVAAERGDSKTCYQINKVLTGKFAPAKGSVRINKQRSKQQKKEQRE